MTKPTSDVITLVVRLWFEKSEVEPTASEWRGQLKHVPTGRVAHFRGLDGMVDRMLALIRDGLDADE
jgi:hypothetical protein